MGVRALNCSAESLHTHQSQIEVICSGFVPAQVGLALVLHGAIAWASRTVNRLKSTGSGIAPLAILHYSDGRTPAANNV